MSFSFCIIDDQIPRLSTIPNFDWINDFDMITEFELRLTMSQFDTVDLWNNEAGLRSLVSQILEASQYSITAFRHPEYLLRHQIRPDVIVLDWDIAGLLPDDRENHLIEFLSKSFCLLVIYTGVDALHELDTLVNSEPFQRFKNRLHVIHKDDPNSWESVVSWVSEQNNHNFSFSFASNMRQSTRNAIEESLVELGSISKNKIFEIFGDGGYSNLDLTEFLSERVKYRLHSEVEQTPPFLASESSSTESNSGDAPRPEFVTENFWSLRLYFKGDASANIRRGDIIKKTGDNKFFLVLNPVCDLGYFWKKNLGHLLLLPLRLIDDQETIERLRNKKPDGNLFSSNINLGSLTSGIDGLPSGVFILPFFPTVEETPNFQCLIGFPKELTHWYVPRPPRTDDGPAKYSQFQDCSRVATINEPFLTPLIQNIVFGISGYGVPDYDSGAKNAINQRLRRANGV